MRYWVPVRDLDVWKLYQIDVNGGPYTALKIIAARVRLEANQFRGRGSRGSHFRNRTVRIAATVERLF